MSGKKILLQVAALVMFAGLVSKLHAYSSYSYLVSTQVEVYQYCWWETSWEEGEEWFDDEGVSQGHAMVLTTWEECNEPEYTYYDTYQGVVYGMNPGCNYDIQFGSDYSSASGTNYWSGTVSIERGMESEPDLYVSEECEPPEPECEVSSVRATDSDHSNRFAGDGGTLYLVGENSAEISANGMSEGCVWSNGETSSSFTATSSSDETYSVGGHGVTVSRLQSVENELSFADLSSESSTSNLKQKLKFPGGASLTFEYALGNTGYKSEKVEKYASPDWAWKRQLTLGMSGSITGRITHPQFSGSYGNWAIWELYAQAQIELSASGGVEINPEQAQSHWSDYISPPTVELTGTLQAGYYVYLDTSWIKIDGDLSASTSASASVRLSGASIQNKFEWLGLDGNVTLKVYFSDPNDPLCDYSGSRTLIDGGSTDWNTIYNLPTS